jgi:hypothetical protein
MIVGDPPLGCEAIKLSSMGETSRFNTATPSEPDLPGLRDPRPKWSVVRIVLGLGALVLVALPAVVAGYGLLPVYRMHARFLVFYSPFACLLVLAYLTYVRDWLVRLMFARFLQASREPHYHSHHEPFYESWKRAMERAGSTLLALVPGLLVCVSFYCMNRYTTRLDESIALASGMYAERLDLGGEIESATVPPDSSPTEPRQPLDRSGPYPGPTARSFEPAEVRAYVLRETAINDIPFFGELTVLYITAFAAAAVALLLMALKEYGRATLGFSDKELVLGRPHESDS